MPAEPTLWQAAAMCAAEREAGESVGGGALPGITVVDLSRVLAGPLCTQMLADHGATVIKVEPPAGDETRTWGPTYLDPDSSAYYSGMNRNKANICLDLAAPQAIAVVERMLAGADVLVENFKAGTLTRWGLDDERLRERYPRLVHCRISGYGTEGPMGGIPGYDALMQAYAGLMSVNGYPDRGPLRVGVPIVDMVTANLAATGIVMALLERHTSGRGQFVDATLLDAALSILHPHAASWLNGGDEPRRTGSRHPSLSPYETFAAADGDFFVGVGNDRQFARLCDFLGLAEVAADTDFATNPARIRNYDRLRELLAAAIARRTRAELGDGLLALGVPGGPVHTIPQALAEPQVAARQMIAQLGSYHAIANPVKLSRTPASVRSAPRAKGADTVAVLETLGYAGEEVARMLAERVAYAAGPGPTDEAGAE